MRMFRMLQMRLVGMVWGVATVAALSVLPPEHLHAAGTPEFSRTVVHRHHVASHSTRSSSSLEHGDHGAAVFLSSAFDTIQKFAVGPPVIVASGVVIPPPVAALGHRAVSDGPPIHGPPKLSVLSRAPPV